MSALSRRTPAQTVRARAQRRRMLDATLALLQDGTPFLDLSVAQIAAAANVSRPTFYAHFGDRRELLIELMKDALAPMFARLADDGPAPDSALGPTRIRPFIALTISTFRDAGPLLLAAIEATSYDTVIRRRMHDAAEPFISAAASTIAAEQAAGRALPGDPHNTASVLVWAVIDNGYRQVRRDTAIDDDALVDTLSTLSLRMVYGESRSQASSP